MAASSIVLRHQYGERDVIENASYQLWDFLYFVTIRKLSYLFSVQYSGHVHLARLVPSRVAIDVFLGCEKIWVVQPLPSPSPLSVRGLTEKKLRS